LYAGRSDEKIEFILFFEVLLSKENLNKSFDLKFEIRIDNNIKEPTITKIFCFFNSFTFDPNKKKRATDAKTAAIITIDRLSIIIIIINNI
jgi:hypothetical protein